MVQLKNLFSENSFYWNLNHIYQLSWLGLEEVHQDDLNWFRRFSYFIFSGGVASGHASTDAEVHKWSIMKPLIFLLMGIPCFSRELHRPKTINVSYLHVENRISVFDLFKLF